MLLGSGSVFPLGCVGGDFPLSDPEISLMTMHLQSLRPWRRLYGNHQSSYHPLSLELVLYNWGNQDDPEDQMETRLWENQKANSGFQKPSLSKRGWCAKPYLSKWVLFCMNKKNIFISIAVHLVSLWHRGLKQLGNSLLHYPLDRNSFRGLCYPPSKLLRYFFRNPQLGRGPRTGHSSNVTPTKYLFILKTTSWKE